MRTESRRKKGFTLIETVTTVGIIAVMAAVVIPQVTRQFDSADPTRLQEDLKSLQTAIETFHVNVRGTFPGDLDDLANQITNGDSTLTTGTTLPVFISTAQTNLWQGPYVDFSLVEAPSDATRPTGYGAKLQDSFVCYNSADDTHGTSAGVATGALNDAACPANAGQKFLTIQITGLATAVTDANFVALNDRFDGVGELNPGTSGRVRFGTVGSNKVVYFLSLPMN
jgi:prepilin-type N-terminal cleavage/methylation domain-containing protein